MFRSLLDTNFVSFSVCTPTSLLLLAKEPSRAAMMASCFDMLWLMVSSSISGSASSFGFSPYSIEISASPNRISGLAAPWPWPSPFWKPGVSSGRPASSSRPSSASISRPRRSPYLLELSKSWSKLGCSRYARSRKISLDTIEGPRVLSG